jgi:signal transduction histidine kinase
MKPRDASRKLIFRSKFRITALVMSVVFVIFGIIGALVPLFGYQKVRDESDAFLSGLLAEEIQNEERPDPSIVVQPGGRKADQISRSFLVKEENGVYTFLARGSDENVSFFETYVKGKEKSLSTVTFEREGRFIYIAPKSQIAVSKDNPTAPVSSSVSSSSVASSAVSSSAPVSSALTSASSLTTLSGGIDTGNDPIYFGIIDRSIEINNLSENCHNLVYILIGVFAALTPIVYLFSGLVLRPTMNAIQEEKEFVANASHELKTPLAIITADCTLLKETSGDNEYLDNISGQCLNMNETILDMIELSKLETSKPTYEEVNVSQLLTDLTLSFDAVAFESGIDYGTEIDDGIVLAKANKKDLTRLFNLLIDNAMKYCEGEKKVIQITLKRQKKGALFTIRNTGCEVRDEDREKIFSRFYQGKSGTDKERKGSGLGLAIVKDISDRYGYDVRVSSSYQQEMTFTLLLR